jgi:hypothetical protein
VCEGDPVEMIDENLAVSFISVLSLLVDNRTELVFERNIQTVFCHAMQFV